MLINVDFTLDSTAVNSAITGGSYDTIRVYESDTYTGSYVLSGTVDLVYGKTEYVYIAYGAALTNWYKISYYNSSTTAESVQSDPIQGTELDFGYDDVTYPVEYPLTSSEKTIVNRVRDILGDRPVLKRDFYDGSTYSSSLGTTTGDNDAYSRVSSDGYVYELEDRGWPLSITVAGTGFITLDNPIAQDYRYLVFSGSESVLTVTGTLEVYYLQFRFSDREIIEAYDRIDYIPGSAKVPTDSIPVSWYYLYARIKLLEKEFQYDAVKSATIADGDTRFSNERALGIRQDELDAKRKQLDDEIEEFIGSLMYSLEGVRID